MPILDNPKLDGVVIETLGIGNIPVEGQVESFPLHRKSERGRCPGVACVPIPDSARNDCEARTRVCAIGSGYH
jgi:hypothetical protein